MAAVSAALFDGVLSITGTSGDDLVTVERVGSRLLVPQTGSNFDAGKVRRIEIDLGDGNDSVRIKVRGRPVGAFGKDTQIAAGDGNNVFTGPNGQRLFFGGADSLLTVGKRGSVLIDGGKPDWFNRNVSDTSLRELTRAESVDNTLSRNDMLNLFAHVTSDAVISQDNFASLRAIVRNKSFYVGLDYVRVLSSYVVDGSVANAHYRGNVLGNLTAESSGGHLQLLVDKWFLGLDHPDTHRAGTNVALTYKHASGSLFSGMPSYTQVDQGVDGDCYFLSAMTSITTKDAQKIVDMFTDNGDDTWTVKLFNKSKPYYVTVDKMLPVDAQNEFVFTGDGQRFDNPHNVLWAALAEKAYAQFAEFGFLETDGPKTNSYSALDEGYANLAMQNILGVNVPSLAKIPQISATAMINAFRQERPVVFVSLESPPSAQIVSDHVYAMLGYNATTQKFELFNPWGIVNNNTGKPGILHLTFAEITQNYGYWGRGPILA